jgi:hypothetical protein
VARISFVLIKKSLANVLLPARNPFLSSASFTGFLGEMSRGWRVVGGAAALCMIAAVGVPSALGAEEEDSSRVLLQRAFRNLYGDDYVQTMSLRASGMGEREMTRRLQIVRKQSSESGKALLRFLSPYYVRGTSVLILENVARSDDLYVYLPAARITRHLSNAQRGDAFFGTDLAYEDIEPKNARDFQISGSKFDGGDHAVCVELELVPRASVESSYERIVSCIEPQRGVILWSDFYRKGRLVKELRVRVDRITSVGSRFIPFEMTMRTLSTGSVTSVVTESYELRGSIPESLFSTWNLEVGDADRDRKKSGS